MEDIRESIRTLYLPEDARTRLTILGMSDDRTYDESYSDPRYFSDILPSHLSEEEIFWVGLQITREVDALDQTRHLGRSSPVEVKAILRLGAAALIVGDIVTAESAVTHLNNRKRHGLSGPLNACKLARKLKHRVIAQ